MTTNAHPRRWPTLTMTAIALMVLMLTLALTARETAASPGQPPTPANPMAHLITSPDADARVRVSWDPPAPTDAVTGYTVRRDDGKTFQSQGGATTYLDDSISPGAAHSYTVTATGAGGTSAASVSASISVPPAPEKPGGATALVTKPTPQDESATVTITWTPPPEPAPEQCADQYPVNRYVVLRNTPSGELAEIADLGPQLDFTHFQVA